MDQMKRTVTNHATHGCSNVQAPENAFRKDSNVMEMMIAAIDQMSQTRFAVSFIVTY